MDTIQNITEHIVRVLDFYYGCHRLPQIQQLETTQIYYLTVLEVKVQQGSQWAKIQVSVGLRSFLQLQGESLALCSSGCLHLASWSPLFFNRH